MVGNFPPPGGYSPGPENSRVWQQLLRENPNRSSRSLYERSHGRKRHCKPRTPSVDGVIDGMNSPLKSSPALLLHRGRIPSGCVTMSGSFLAGPPREADKGGKRGIEGDFPLCDRGRVPHAPPCWRGKGAQTCLVHSLPGSPALWAGDFN